MKEIIEVARSFSMKKNLGNYESADFFCSAKRECLLDEADDISEKLLIFCRREVIKDLNAFLVSKEKTPVQKVSPKGESITVENIDFS
jgi:hypothetical protein